MCRSPIHGSMHFYALFVPFSQQPRLRFDSRLTYKVGSNLCFLFASIEVIWRTMPEVSKKLKHLISDESKLPKEGLSCDKTSVLKDLSDILEHLESSEDAKVGLDDLGARMIECGGQEKGKQQDSHEALMWIFNWMKELDPKALEFMAMEFKCSSECLEGACLYQGEPMTIGVNEIEIELGQAKSKKGIGELLQDKVKQVWEVKEFKCLAKDSTGFGCPSGKAYTALIQKLKESTDDAEKKQCKLELEKCTGKRTESYQGDPSVVVVHLKRWVVVDRAVGKISTTVDLEVQKVQKMWEKHYALMGVLRHVGAGPHQGHWVALTRDEVRPGSGWHEYEKGRCYEISQRCISENASVLVFRKVDAAVADEFGKTDRYGGSSRSRRAHLR